MRQRGNGLFFGIGMLFHPVVFGGLFLVLAVFLLTHWWLLISFPVCVVGGVIFKLIQTTYEEKAEYRERAAFAKHVSLHKGMYRYPRQCTYCKREGSV